MQGGAGGGTRGGPAVTTGVVTAVAVGLLMLVWAAASGPAPLVGSAGRMRDFVAPPTPTALPTTPPAGRSARELLRDVRPVADLSWLGDLVLWALFLALLAGVVWLLRVLWVHRWRRPPAPVQVDVDVLPELPEVAESVSRDAGAQLAAVALGSPDDGIIACWLRLEGSIAAAGVPRRPAETSTEYAVRVLHALDVDPAALGRLAGLYREARFSEHPLGEPERTAARSALQRLHEDLR